MTSPEQSQLRRWRDEPATMVRELFGVTPDAWQEEALQAFPRSPRLAMRAAAGPGKTAVLAWLAWNFLLTRPHPRVGVTSVTRSNLKAGLWAELAVWRGRAPLLQAEFEQTGDVIVARAHPQTWRLEARGWASDATKDQIGNALAGLHAPYVMWLMDETGTYPPSILPIAEGIFAGAPTEAHIVQAGNPWQRSGPLYQACVSSRSLWRVVEITGDPDDPQRSPRIPIEHARAQIAQYGRDNPWVMVTILGQFPPSGVNQLISEDDVIAAQKRYYREHEIGPAAKVIGVDVARFGDDSSVICCRQGIQCLPPITLRNVDSLQGAGRVARQWIEWQADACFLDATGGWGAGWGDQLRALGKAPINVNFAAEPHDRARYFNKRAEMYFEAAAWIKAGGALVPSAGLLSGLSQVTYAFKGDRFILEDKAQIKARLGFSPDEADAFVLTFAEPVMARAQQAILPGLNPLALPSRSRAEDYDPIWSAADMPKGRGAPRNWTPGKGFS